MKRKAPTQKQVTVHAAQEALLGSLIGRMQHTASMGLSYGADNNDRDMYQVCGYRRTIEFEHYYNYYKRDPVAKTLIDKVPEAVWKSNPVVSEIESGDTASALEEGYIELEKRLKLHNKMMRADKLLGLGQYSILLLGFNDSEDFSIPVVQTGALQIQYVHPYSQNSVSIKTFESNKMDPRFGQPVLYEVKVGGSDYNISPDASSTQSIMVHHTRILHFVERPLETDIYGTPRLEEVYNNIQNIDKIAGGSAEMFWRGARPGYVAKAQKDARIDALSASDMQDQMDEFDHNLRRWLKLEGMDVQELSPQVVSPKEHIDTQLELVCIAKGIPKRILLGSERGELASSQDMNTWNELILQRMVNHASPVMLRPFIDIMIQYKILPEPKEGAYIIEWPELSVIGEKEKAEINYTKVKALAEYVKAPGANMIYPPELFLEKILELSKEEVMDLMADMKKMLAELPPIPEEPESPQGEDE